MCASHFSPSKRISRVTFLYFLALFAGITCGLLPFSFLHHLGASLSDIFIKIFKLISLPLISLSLISTLTTYAENGHAKAIWKKTIYYTISTTLIAATVSCVLYCLISPPNIMTMASSAPESASSTNYLSYLTSLVPTNIFSPFLEHQVMGVLALSIVIGVAIGHIPDTTARSSISNFFKGAHGLFLVLTSWVVKLIPLALFGFILTTVRELHHGGTIGGLSHYLAVVVLANLVQGFIILPLFLRRHHIKPYHAMKGMMPALSVAFFSKSSAGTLPITMDTIERNLGVDPKTSRFVLPLCTSLNMNGCAAFIFATVVYLMQNNGLTLSIPLLGLWIVIATVAAIGNAGVPMGCFFLSASLLTSMDVPITLLGLILPFYSLIDMIETSLNVWSDACVAKIIDGEAKSALRA